MEKNWDMFFDMLMVHEGAFQDDQRDSGNSQGDGHGNEGSTMWGVTAWNWAKYTDKPAPKDVMKALTKEDVKPFVKTQYWDNVRADQLPNGLDICVADMAYNGGGRRSVKILQRAVAAKPDGLIGSKTIAACHDLTPKDALDKYHHGRQQYYESLDDFKIYGKGWSRRNKETLELALGLLNE